MHEEQDSWLLLHLLTCLLPDGTADGLMGHPIGSHQTVGRLESGPVSAHLSGQAALWISSHAGCHAHQAPASSWIAYLGRSKRFLSPCQRIGEAASIHRFLLCGVSLLLSSSSSHVMTA